MTVAETDSDLSNELKRSLECNFDKSLTFNVKTGFNQIEISLIRQPHQCFILSNSCFTKIPMWYPGSGLELDCIDS